MIIGVESYLENNNNVALRKVEQKREGASFSNDIRKLILTLNILLLILFM